MFGTAVSVIASWLSQKFQLRLAMHQVTFAPIQAQQSRVWPDQGMRWRERVFGCSACWNKEERCVVCVSQHSQGLGHLVRSSFLSACGEENLSLLFFPLPLSFSVFCSSLAVNSMLTAVLYKNPRDQTSMLFSDPCNLLQSLSVNKMRVVTRAAQEAEKSKFK